MAIHRKKVLNAIPMQALLFQSKSYIGNNCLLVFRCPHKSGASGLPWILLSDTRKTTIHQDRLGYMIRAGQVHCPAPPLRFDITCDYFLCLY